MRRNKKFVSFIAILLAVLMAFSLIASVLPIIAHADQSELDAIKQKKDELASQASSVTEKLQGLRDQQATVMEQKDVLDERNVYTKQQIELTEEQLKVCAEMIKEKQAEVAAAKALEEKQLDAYRVRVRAMEESGGYNILALIIQSNNFSQLIAAIDDIGQIMESDRKLEDAYIAARKEYEAVEAEYEAQYETLSETQAGLEAEKEELEKQLKEADELLESLAADIEKAEEEQRILEAARAAADAQIRSLVAEINAQEQQWVQESGGGGEAFQAVTGTGSLCWPVPSSYRISSTYKYRWGRWHNGIDIDGYGLDGSAVVACDSGVVVTASYSSSLGNYVVISHGNGMQTMYAHHSGLAVSAGDTVSQGQTIAYLGRTGNATGTHCHLEVFVNGSNVDPLGYFSGYVLEPGAAD